MNYRANLQRMYNARQHCFVGMLTAQMEGKTNAEAYWAMQLGEADRAYEEACERYGEPYTPLCQLPLFLSGCRGVTFVREE